MPAKLPSPDAEGVVFLIDLSGYVYRAYHALPPLSSSKGEPTHAVMGAVTMLQKVVNERKPAMLAVAMDSRAPSFRKAIDPRYKATRPPAPPDLSGQMARCEQIVRAYNIPIYEKPGLEADDLIAAFVARASADGVRVVIVSADKDLMQLVHDGDDHVLMWDSMRDKVYGAEEVQDKLGVRPSQVRDYLALTGDTSDNVPGVPGVGPKTASDLLREFGTLDGIYQHLDQVKRPKLRENLKQFEADARLSQKLVSLDASASVPWDREHLRYGGRDEAELRRLFAELEFTRLLSQLPAPRVQQRTFRAVTTRAELEAFAERARASKTLGFDLRASEPDPNRAAILGVALSSAPGEGFYAPIAHRYLGAPAQVSLGDVGQVLGPLLASSEVRKIAHDMKTQEVLLARHGILLGDDVRGGSVFDVDIASYLLDPEAPHTLAAIARRELDVVLGGGEQTAERPAPKGPKRGRAVPFDEVDIPAAVNDAAPAAAACVSLAERLAPRLVSDGLAKLYEEIEIPLSRVLAQMELVGVLVDVECLARIGARVEQELRAIEGRVKETVGHDFAVRSRDQLETILFDELELPVLKRTPKGGRSTDAEVLEELAGKHPLPKLLLEYRELDKLKGTYIDALPRYVNPKTGRIHTRFTQTVAATGRLASSDPNLQNIPIRTDLGQEIRSAFVAPPGCVLVSADYSQIELRVLAHLSQDPMLVEAYRKADDVHTLTASVVFDVDRSAVTNDMRRQAKTINFGVIYGMGDAALGRQLGIPREQAARFIESYFARYEGVARFMERTVEAARRGEAVRTMLGRRRFLPNLHSANRGLRFEAERIARNTPIQGTAADILKLAMVKLGRGEVVQGARMVLTVHDELVFEVPEARAAEASRAVKEAMEGALALDVPLVVEVGAGKNWASAH